MREYDYEECSYESYYSDRDDPNIYSEWARWGLEFCYHPDDFIKEKEDLERQKNQARFQKDFVRF